MIDDPDDPKLTWISNEGIRNLSDLQQYCSKKHSICPPLIAFHENVPVGCIVQDMDDLSFGGLYVVQTMRGLGIGSVLLQTAAFYSYTLFGAKTVCTHVEVDNVASIRTHLKAGWSQDSDSVYVWPEFSTC